mgnify:CR=1 FL=1
MEWISFQVSYPTLGWNESLFRQAVWPSDRVNYFSGKLSDPRMEWIIFQASYPTLGQSKSVLKQVVNVDDSLNQFSFTLSTEATNLFSL